MKPSNVNLKIFFTFLVIILFMGLVVWGYISTETHKKPTVANHLADYDYLYNFYVASNPNIKNRTYYGNGSAPVTLIVYMRPKTDSAKMFFDKIFPKLNEEFINDGKLRIYFKTQLSSYDMKSATFEYNVSKYLYCNKNKEFNTNYIDIIRNGVNGLNLSEIGNFDKKCLDSAHPEIIEDVSEVENFGLVGISPVIYVGIGGNFNSIIKGIPSYAYLRRIIRNKQIQLGD